MRAMPSPTDMIGADFADVDGAVVILDLVPENACNLVCPNLSHIFSFLVPVCREFAAHFRQMSAHGAVIYRGTDARRYAADEFRIDGHARAGLFVRRCAPVRVPVGRAARR